MTIRLGPVAREQLHPTFAAAFADYAVDMSYMTRERLSARAVKNGVDLDISVGAYDGDRMVGFTLIGLGSRDGAPAAFDAGTGIVAGFRGQGLARRMMEHAVPALRRRGVTLFLLEVLAENEPAIRAYRKAGFEVTRMLRCYQAGLPRPAGANGPGPGADVRPGDRSVVDAFRGEADWTPSWENGFAAIERIPDELVVLVAHRGGRRAGVIVYSPMFNWVMSLIVRRSDRRHGVASALVRALIDRLPPGLASLKLLNVDSSDTGMTALLERLGFDHTLDQYEMALRISSS